MQPDFQHVMTMIIGAGLVVFVIGATLLLLAFRAFGTAKRGDIKHVVLLAITIGFILISCVGLLVWTSIQH